MSLAQCIAAATALAALAGTTPDVAAQAAARAAPEAAYQLGDRLAASAPAPASRPGRKGDFKLTEWDALVPRDWDPMKEFKDLNLGAMRDGDPRATAALERLKRAFDNAPTQPALNDTRIRIAGFVVPLEAEGGLLREFLLVPYFGACIHSPPPPANQIIHVSAATPIKGFRAMDPVWVSGTLRTGISDTPMGTSGYRMDVEAVAPYREGK